MPDTRHVLRAGAFDHFVRVSARCAFRFDSDPDDRGGYYGFRVVINGTRGETYCRMVRGGAFYYFQENVRCAYRSNNENEPDARLDFGGFRVIVSGMRRKK